MENQLKKWLKGNGLHGMVANIEGIYQRITKKFSVKASGVAVANSTSYEISEAHKTHMLEVELKQFQAWAEVHLRTIR